MLKLFRKRQQPSAASGIWLKVGQWADGRLRQVAETLNRRTTRWSRRSIKAGLIVFCIMYSGVCAYYLLKGTTGTIQPDHISVPDHAIIPGKEVVKDGTSLLSPEAYNRLLSFRHYLDSLQQSPQGQLEYEQIVSEHPGIRDSVEYIISLHERQTKNVEYGKEK